jgi:hypothetical protein
MAKVLTDDSNYTAIANAIRAKKGVETTYLPSEMAAAIGSIDAANLDALSVNANGTYTPTSPKNGFSQVTVDVPNSYGAGDEGKVVSNGALVAQSTQSITENGTYDTTLKNQVTVNVSGGGGGEIIFGTNNPTSATGNDGDTYVKYHMGLSTTVTVTGGYNGGAVVAVMIENTQVFTATASDTYNLNYNVTQADVSTDIGTVSILITPPSSNTGELYVTVTGPNNIITCNPPKQGANTSYGYGNYSNTDYLIGTSGERIADALYIKQNGAWKGVGDEV